MSRAAVSCGVRSGYVARQTCHISLDLSCHGRCRAVTYNTAASFDRAHSYKRRRCLVAPIRRRRIYCSTLGGTAAFCFYLIKIVQTLTN
jgi:hypothetical protein